MPIDSSILAAAQGEQKEEPMLVSPSRLPNTGSFSMGAVPRFWFCSMGSKHLYRVSIHHACAEYGNSL